MRQFGVIFGGPSPEHDISILTGLQAARALHKSGAKVIGLFWNKLGEWYQVDPLAEASAFASSQPAGAQPLFLRLGSEPGFYPPSGRLSKGKALELEAVMNCCHGGAGEDGSLQAILDLMGIPYSGPNARTALIGMDKLAFHALMTQNSISALPREPLFKSTEALSFDGPYIVKPRFGGSSIGIEVVADLETAKMRLDANIHLRSGAVVEPYRPELFDIQVAARSFPAFELSAIERPLKKGAVGEILSYSDKYIAGEGMATAPRELPAELDPKVEQEIRTTAAKVTELVGLRGVMRVDFLMAEDSSLYINEVNTIPGSLSHYLWIEPKIPFERLVTQLMEEAIASPTYVAVVAGADGSVLRTASSIAAKLA